jgi:hypothetical protein
MKEYKERGLDHVTAVEFLIFRGFITGSDANRTGIKETEYEKETVGFYNGNRAEKSHNCNFAYYHSYFRV